MTAVPPDPDPARARPPAATLAWVCGAVGAGARVDGWMVAPGGSACAIHAVDVVDRSGRRHPLVLKRFFRGDWLAREPDIAACEARHLELLGGVALPVPRLVAADTDASHCDLPALLMTRLPGRVALWTDDRDAWLGQLASTLRDLHQLPDELARAFEPYRHYGDPGAVRVPPWTRRPDVWERVITRLGDAPPEVTPGFVHRDYHPNNLLWLRGRISGVLDFTDSSWGPRPVDVGHCRVNLAQLQGPDVADRFRALYNELAGGAAHHDPYWDLVSLMNVLPGPEVVYEGWTRLGVRHLTDEICWSRLDELAARAVADLA